MERYREGNIEWLEFDLLSDFKGLTHAVFLRNGGVSSAPFHSLNLGFYTEDEAAHVEKNRELIEHILKKKIVNSTKCTSPKLAHGDKIVKVEASSPYEILNCDGLITAERDKVLLTTHADCQIVLFYDPILNVIANVHCGWRGNVLNVYQKTVEALKNTFGCNPANLLACMGPSLGPDEAEFINYRHDFPEEFWSFQTRPNYFDLWAIGEEQLQIAGILPHHIEIARLSTYSNSHDFFSYRRENKTGRHGTIIALT